MEWTDKGMIQQAEQRQEIGCAICARKDWLEHRYHVYLFREPEKATLEQDQDEVVQDELDEETGRQKLYSRTMNDGCYCLGSAEAVAVELHVAPTRTLCQGHAPDICIR